MEDGVGRNTLRLIAHRGYASRYPENSLAAINGAINAGAGYIEMDVQLSADGVPVLFHDRDLQRLCGVSGAVHEQAASSLLNLTLQSPIAISAHPTKEKLCSLETAVGTMARNRHVHFFVELKRIAIHHFGARQVLDKVMNILAPVRAQCTLISYDLPIIREAQAKNWPSLGFIHDRWADFDHSDQALSDLDFLFCDIASLPSEGDLSVGESHLAVYECTDINRALQLYERGVEYVETFAIAEMLNALKQSHHEKV